MKIPKIAWVIVGFLAAVAGFIILENNPVIGFLLMMAGVAVLFIVSISIMHISGQVKENPFQNGSAAADKFSSHDSTFQENGDVWDRLTEKQEKQP